ncbi:MAG TPA: hypothetical protein VFZ20_26385, partial [Longimicrobium sp.]
LDIPPPVEPARPVSAWGVAREPARAESVRSWSAPVRDDAADEPEDRTAVHPREEERRPAYPRLDEDPAV